MLLLRFPLNSEVLALLSAIVTLSEQPALLTAPPNVFGGQGGQKMYYGYRVIAQYILMARLYTKKAGSMA